MPTVEAQIAVDQPQRYLVQLCKHATAMNDTPMHHAGAHSDRHGDVPVRAEYSDGAGTLTFGPWGRCTLAATAGVLTVRVEADDEEDVRRIQGIVAADLERFGRRIGLTVAWRPSP